MTDWLLESEFTEEDAPLAPPRMAQRVMTPTTLRATTARPRADGKFLFVGDEKFYLRGVTYGPFAPGPDGCEYGTRQRVARDFQAIRAAGFNSIRTYTVPPLWLLDLAREHGLFAMVGLAWEQHVAFLDGRRRRREIEQRLHRSIRSCAAHPAILCYSVGNEIPAPLVRWYGPRRVERWIKNLCDVTRAAHPDALVTYVNFPSTEYLDLPFIDLVAFNVYLESDDALRRYLARLHHVAGDRPLLVAELGLDAQRNGAEVQADAVARQVSITASAGCAGSFVFSWTDEWHRGGHEVTDWQFGLTDRERRPKPALASVTRAMSGAPFLRECAWPKISVVVCTYNGSRTLGECLREIAHLDYPNFETIVVDDGSTDRTAEVAREFDVRLISTSNQGLSHARNVGLHAATGDIVAYIDDDAYPDREWLKYLAQAFGQSEHAGIGGPNVVPASDSVTAHLVAHSPGGPTHVLLDDTEAEHIPGCNMAFRRARLLEVGGFDEQFRIAGDDVDICWKLTARGATLGFSPAALVWHHRRGSIRAYLRQQFNYGRAEAMLERKWPAKYNAAGYLTWSGRLYGGGYLYSWPLCQRRIYHGTWGTALFQSVYHTSPTLWRSLPIMPEWLMLTLLLLAVTSGAIGYPPLIWAGPLAAAAGLMTFVAVSIAAWRAPIDLRARSIAQRARCRVTLVLLHLLQPLVRLLGRMRLGLTPLRSRGVRGFAFPWVRSMTMWSEQWQSCEDRLAKIEHDLRRNGAVVHRGGEFDRWDLELCAGIFGGARLHLTVEEHGAGCQLVRVRTWPECKTGTMLLLGIALVLSAFATSRASVPGMISTILVSAVLLAAHVRQCGAAIATMRRALQCLGASRAS